MLPKILASVLFLVIGLFLFIIKSLFYIGLQNVFLGWLPIGGKFKIESYQLKEMDGEIYSNLVNFKSEFINKNKDVQVFLGDEFKLQRKFAFMSMKKFIDDFLKNDVFSNVFPLKGLNCLLSDSYIPNYFIFLKNFENYCVNYLHNFKLRCVDVLSEDDFENYLNNNDNVVMFKCVEKLSFLNYKKNLVYFDPFHISCCGSFDYFGQIALHLSDNLNLAKTNNYDKNSYMVKFALNLTDAKIVDLKYLERLLIATLIEYCEEIFLKFNHYKLVCQKHGENIYSAFDILNDLNSKLYEINSFNDKFNFIKLDRSQRTDKLLNYYNYLYKNLNLNFKSDDLISFKENIDLFASVEEVLLLTFINNLGVFAKLMNYDVIDNNDGQYAIVNLNLIDKISL